MGGHLLHAGERFETAQPRHVLVEDYQVEVLLLHPVEGVETVIHGDDFISLLTEEKNMGFQQIDLVIGPKQGFTLHIARFDFLQQTRNTPQRNVPRQAI